MNPNLQLLSKYFAGGAIAGGGISALLNYVKDVNRMTTENLADNNKTDDDDTLYLKVRKPRTKAAGEEPVKVTPDPNVLSQYLKLMGGMGGVAAGYMGIRNFYNKVRKDALQDELDDAQEAYVGTLASKKDQEELKYASTGANVGAGGLALLSLLALGSAAGTNALLDRYSPAPKSPRGKGGRKLKREMPKRVVLDRAGEKDDKVLYNRQNDVEVAADELEHMIRSATVDPQRASDSGLMDLIEAIADGRLEEVKTATADLGVNHAFNITKGAADGKERSLAREMAIGIIARDPLLKEAFGPVVAAELYDMMPHHCQLIRNVGEHEKLAARGAAIIATADYHYNLGEEFGLHGDDFEKSAGLTRYLPMAVVLDNLLKQDDGENIDEEEPSNFYIKGEDSHDEDGEEGEVVEEDEDGGEKDSIDRVFEDGIGTG